MHSSIDIVREASMPDTLEGREPPTVQTGLWVPEHDWLYAVMRMPANTAPRFRLIDLASACITLALGPAGSEQRVADYLASRLARRDPRTRRRGCEVWAEQFELIRRAHRARWNSYPNPMFEFDHLVTACVAVVMELPDAAQQALAQARSNWCDRVGSAPGTIN